MLCYVVCIFTFARWVAFRTPPSCTTVYCMMCSGDSYYVNSYLVNRARMAAPLPAKALTPCELFEMKSTAFRKAGGAGAHRSYTSISEHRSASASRGQDSCLFVCCASVRQIPCNLQRLFTQLLYVCCLPDIPCMCATSTMHFAAKTIPITTIVAR